MILPLCFKITTTGVDILSLVNVNFYSYKHIQFSCHSFLMFILSELLLFYYTGQVFICPTLSLPFITPSDRK